MSKETIDEKEIKFNESKFIAGDMSSDIKDLIEEIQKLKKRVKKLEDKINI